MAFKKLRVGIAGLGRMGKRHAVNFHYLVPGATVVAASSPVQAELDWAKENIEDVGTYLNYDEMLARDDIDAVVVASVTAAHAIQALAAIKKGNHVLCEKPLSLDLSVAQSIIDAWTGSRKTYPGQKVMCGFSRRFDASYREAHDKVTNKEYGSAVVFRSQTADLHDATGFFVDYAKTSGGIFLDCSIHDIDLMLWFLGEDCKIKSLQAVGVAACHPDLLNHNDRDNAIATVELYNNRIANLYCSRMMAAGQEDTTEIICEKGSLRVNMLGRKNHVEIHDSRGARRELPQHYYERFRDAFATEANEFTRCCLDNLPPPISLESSVKAIAIGQALQHSLISGEKVVFAEDGQKF